MNVVWKTALAAGIAVAAMAGGAQAADFGEYRGIAGNSYETSRSFSGRDRFVDEDDDVGLQVAERIERHRRPGWDRHPPGRPYYGRPGWGRHDDCRVIVTRRINRWGEMVIRRARVCR